MLEFKVYLDKKLIQRSLLSKGEITVGRSSENDLVLPNQHVSRLHLVIAQEGDAFRLEDRSSNGVLLDGKPVAGSTLLPPQCKLGVYPFEIDCSRRQEDHTVPIPKKTPQAVLQEKDRRQEAYASNAPLRNHFGILIGESPAMQQIYRLIEDVSGHPVTVLIRGEHGTGKELVARAIHEASARRNEPFIAVNCAAIPLDLIESELFGHEKGAFTGAQTTQKGKIEEADKGTLFLDEIGELSPAAQAKLLRFLQGKVVMRLGSARETPVDTRVVAATNKDLERAVEKGTFRADLYYRIKVVQILLPPLRDRKEDIPLLAAHFIERLGEELNLPARPVLTDEALHRLQSADWPGNVRQMENAFYSALVRSRSPQLLDETLLFDSEAWNSPAEMEDEAPLDAISKELLLKILKESSWDTAKAAETLKVSRGTVYYKLKKYGINLREAAKRSANM
ncbi:MAG: sigma 54-interacting transcriptional regulator [Candidatus Manganitrophus sp. SA1]|nr:sigma 54-interacting transcriptional regulator [Candidatus Manganitrophus morganii]